MIKSLTLKQAIAQAFDIDGRTIPDFTSSKPVQEARNWLERNKHTFEYQRNYLDKGLVVYAFGGGNPQFTVVETDDDLKQFAGAQVFATLSVPKRGRKSKSQQRRENAMSGNDVNANIGADQTPVIASAPNDEASSGGTVIDPIDEKE